MKTKFIACCFIFLVLISAIRLFPVVRAYDSYDDLILAFKTLAAAYPKMVSYETVGKTVQNRDIIIFKIGNPAGNRVLFDGTMHGTESLGGELLYLYANWLLTSNDSVASSILSKAYTLLIPVVNVDEYNKARENANGVDLNRNFATNWEHASSDPDDDTYRGPAPLSEPESKTLISVFQRFEPSFYVNLHMWASPYYAGSYYGNATYYRLLVKKIASLSRELGVTPFRYAGEFRGTGLAISDAAKAGITSFLIELTDRAVSSSEIENVILPRFKPVAAVLSLENPTDTLPPTTLDDYDNLWHNEDFTIFLTATDDASGVFETYYRINDGPVNNVSTNGQPHITTESANNTLEYWSLDNAGNEELPHRILTGIKFDKTPPEANAGQAKIITVGTTLTFNAHADMRTSDNIGIVSYYWDFGDGARLVGETANHTYNHVGNYTVTLTIRDAAKNTATTSVNVTVLPDTDGDGVPDVADADDDNDGLPDTWEEANGLNTLDPKDASQDPDGDSLTNFQEYQKNTDPNTNSPSASMWIASAAAALTLVAILIFVRVSASRKRMTQEKSALASFE